jgi:hypothetical protein
MRLPAALRVVLISFAVAMCSVCVFAQSTGGRIVGHVTDPTGANIPGATITLTENATGAVHTSQTNGSGEYSVLQLPVGVYDVVVEHSGFKQNVRKGVRLELNQVLTVDAVLSVGSRDESVQVTGEAPLVDTTSTQLGAVVDEREVVKLPLNARDTYQLLQLQPGVQGVGGSDLFFGSNQAGGVAVNGGRSRSNNFSVNGGDANDLFVNSPGIQPTPDSIQEFRVITNTFDAEYGRNSGAVVNVVTKSGTNQYHGSVYEFFRNQIFNAKGFLDVRRPDDKQNQFGGTFGGPIKKDRTFFFASYEGRRVIHGLSSDPVVVPTAAERGGDFSQSPFGGTLGTDALAQILNNRPGCAAGIAAVGGVTPAAGTPWSSIFPTNQIPTQCFDPVAQNLMNLYVPCPNADPTCSNLANGDGIFRSIPNLNSHENQFTLKLDHKINDRQNLSAYYYYNNAFESNPFTRFEAETPNLLQGFGNNSVTHTQQFNISHTWNLNPTSVNEIRLTYFREAQPIFLHPQHTANVTSVCTTAAQFCFNGNTDVPGVITPDPTGKTGITPGLGPNHEGVPFVTISGGFTIGNDFEGELPQTGNTYQAADNFTKVFGNHTTKFGIDYRNQRFLQTLFFDPNGEFAYSGGGPNDFAALRNADGTSNFFPNFLIGLPDTFLQGSTQTEDVRGNSIYLYGQDSWKIRPNFTLNYGLRWELNQPLYDAGGRYQTFRPGQATTTYPCLLAADNPLNPTPGTPVSCDPGSGNEAIFPLGLVVPGDKGVPKGLTSTYYHAFAPRIGIAWDPWHDGKTTIRGGFGIFYNPIEQLALEQFQAEPPFGGSTSVSEPFFNTPFIPQSCTVPCGANQPGTIPNPFGGVLTPPHGTPIDWSRFRPLLLFGEFQPHMRSQYTEQYNFGIQHEILRDTVFSIGYVGSQGHRLLATRDLNPGNPQTCLDLNATLGDGTCGPFLEDSSYFIAPNTVIAPQGLHLPYNAGSGGLFVPGGTTVGPNGITLVGLRQFSSPFCQPFTGTGCPADGTEVFNSIFAQDTVANSNYNSLQASLEKRFSHGLQFEVAYTWSKSQDDASSFENLLRPFCDASSGPHCNKALSLFDARHRLVISYLWQLPTPKYEGIAGKIVDGWAISGISSFQSGFPIRLESNADNELENSFDFELPGRPNLVAPLHILDPRKNNGFYFDPTSFSLPAVADGTLGSAPRTICCGPGIDNTDFSLQKVTRVGENKSVEFRAEFFNIFNHTQFLNPDGNISDGSRFGTVFRTRDPRNIQFALKYAF